MPIICVHRQTQAGNDRRLGPVADRCIALAYRKMRCCRPNLAHVLQQLAHLTQARAIRALWIRTCQRKNTKSAENGTRRTKLSSPGLQLAGGMPPTVSIRST